MKKALVVIAKEGFQDHEYQGTVDGLSAKGFDMTIASSQAGICQGKFGGKMNADIGLSDVVVADYDHIAFIGGPGAAALADNADAKRIAIESVEQHKVLGAICIAPTILARAGVLKGKKATVWDSGGVQAGILAQEGAEYTGEDVTVDGRIVTANGPQAAEKFGKTLADMKS